MQKKQLIEIKISCDSELKKMLEKNIDFIKERTNSKKINFVDGELKNAIKFTIKQKEILMDLVNEGLKNKDVEYEI